ncbi:BET1-like protein isoform X1 [Dasypus novemcinctus]|uniref:BET1-like protein isoform X1 n=1 Tax=Dasypus novemcinctus TaxID=9361 RepID=UPI00265E466B|nr:BET1-like protein isoform X1 [Dasypus novemcinctus]
MADWARAQSPGAVEEILDRENKRMADSLASKVTRLKSGCRRPEPVPGWHGLGLHKHDRSAHREREALLHNGTVWARQQEASLWCGCGPDCGLLHPLLPRVEGKDMSKWVLASCICGRPG